MKLKVVHFVMSLWPAGVEIWLLRLLKQLNNDNYEFHIIVQKEQVADLEIEFKKIGVHIHRCIGAPNPFLFAKNFFEIFREIGKIDVLHSHVHHFSGYIIFLGWMLKIPKLISHCHSDTRSIRKTDSLLRKMYNFLMEILIHFFATDKLSVSGDAAADLYFTPQKAIFMPCGIDLADFSLPKIPTKQYYDEFALPVNCQIIAHVGRFSYPKNHSFLIDIFEKINQKDQGIFLLLIGNGELRQQIEEKVSQLGIHENVRFLGLRRDIPSLLSIADIFLFPSRYEGMPVSVVEAQATGLKCVISSHLPAELTIIQDLIYRVDLSASANTWADKILTIIEQKNMDKAIAAHSVINSPFNIKNNIKSLQKIYNSESP